MRRCRVVSYVLLVLSLAVGGVLSAWDTSFCTQVPANGGPSLPTVPDQFTVGIQMNVESSGRTMEIHEVYDGVNNRGAVRILDRNLHVRYIYSYETGEMFTIVEEEKVCQVSDLSSTSQTFIFGYNATGGKPHIFSGAGALHFGGQYEEQYVENSNLNVRGIPVNQWYQCMYFDDMDTTMRVNYFWSDPEKWTAASGDIQVPVRATVEGIDGTGRTFLHSYEFVNYRGNHVAESLMMIPSHLYCPRLSQPLEMPTMPNYFKFRSEMLTPDWENLISLPLAFIAPMDERYDFDQKLFRLDYRPLPDAFQLSSDDIKSNGMRREIHDYNTGVAYITDLALGNCSVRKISDTAQHPESDLSGLQTLKLSNPEHFFKFDAADFSFVGTRLERNIDTDIFIGKGTFLLNGVNQTSQYEWQFMNNKWTANIGQVLETREPVKLTIDVTVTLSGMIKQFRIIYNMFDFSQEEPSPQEFDISPCFRGEHFQHYKVAIPGTYTGIVTGRMSKFKYESVKALSSVMGISPIRVANLMIDFDTDYIWLIFSVLDKAPIAGDIDNAPELTLVQAVENLRSAVENHRLIINVDTTTQVVARYNSLMEIDRNTYFSVNDDWKFTAGEMGGIAIGMLILGILLTSIVAILYIMKSRAPGGGRV